MPRTSKKVNVKQLNGSQEIQEHEKSNSTQRWTKNNSIKPHGKSDKCENNFMHLGHQDNTP